MPKSIEQVRAALLAMMTELSMTTREIAPCVKIQHGRRRGERYGIDAIYGFIEGKRPDECYVDIALAVLVAFPRLR